MSPVQISHKYHNFIAPNAQILVDNEDIGKKYGAKPLAITVKQSVGMPPDLSFLLNDPGRAWINTNLFEVHKPLEVKMGYADIFETVFSGETVVIKSIFPSSSVTQIEVYGEGKNGKVGASPIVGLPLCSLAYGSTLNSFTSISSAEAATDTVRCMATCIGLPEITVGTLVTLTGLGLKFNKNYLVEEVVHKLDSLSGFRSEFKGKMVLPKRPFISKK